MQLKYVILKVFDLDVTTVQKWDIKNTSMALEFPVWNFKPAGSKQAVSLLCLVAGAKERGCYYVSYSL